MTKTGWLLCGHGSRREAGAKAFERFTDALKSRNPDTIIEQGFLELAQPDYETAVSNIYNRGVREILAQPILLFTGVHIMQDVPEMMHAFEQKFPGLKIRLGNYIGVSDEIVELAEKRIREAAGNLSDIEKKDVCILNILIGASVPQANADAAALTRLVWEKTGAGFATYGFVSRMASPGVSDMLALVDRLPYNTVIVNPILFFPGVYLERIHSAVEAFKHVTKKQVIVTDTLQTDDLLCKAVEKAISQVEAGTVNLMETWIDSSLLDSSLHPHDDHDHGHHHADHHSHHGKH